MLDCMAREWDAEKAALATGLGRPLGAFTTHSPLVGTQPGGGQGAQVGVATPSGAFSPFFQGGVVSSATTPGAAAAGGGPGRGTPQGTPGGAVTQAAVGGNIVCSSGTSGRLDAYAGAMSRLTDARLRGTPVDAADAFQAALARVPGATEGAPGASLGEMWRAVASVLRGASAHGGPGMVCGARQYLEAGHVAFMRAVVARDPVRAALGGSATPLALLHAFLRVKLRDVGPLDFDSGAPGGGGGATASPGGAVVDTAWQCAFYAARSGFTSEAVASAARGRSGGDLATLLATWSTGSSAGGGATALAPLSQAAAAAAAEEADRCLREPPGRPGRAHRAALAAMLAGDGVLADAVQSTFPEVCPTIEDFLWFKLATVRSAGRSSNGGNGANGGADYLPFVTPGGPGGSDDAASGPGSYSLADLQSYLARFPASHYAKNGKEPLLAATVLVLSLRLGAAVTFLTRDPLAEGFAVEGAHVAASIAAAGPNAMAGAGIETGGEVANAVGGVLLALGRQLAGGSPVFAADYLSLAAAPLAAAARASGVRGARAEEDSVLGALLREVLRHAGAPAALLDARPPGSTPVLARLLPDEAARGRLVMGAAGECEAGGLIAQALELYLRLGAHDAALGLITRQLGDAMSSLDGDAPSRIASLRAQGVPLAQQAAAHHTGGDTVTAFNQLCALADVLAMARAGRHGDVLAAVRTVPELSFLPLDPARSDRCASQLDSLHPAVLARLPDFLLAVARAVAAPGGVAGMALAPGAPPAAAERARRDAQAALASFTVSSRFRIPPFVFAELARLAPVA
jgi:hypothetical protein